MSNRKSSDSPITLVAPYPESFESPQAEMVWIKKNIRINGKKVRWEFIEQFINRSRAFRREIPATHLRLLKLELGLAQPYAVYLFRAHEMQKKGST